MSYKTEVDNKYTVYVYLKYMGNSTAKFEMVGDYTQEEEATVKTAKNIMNIILNIINLINRCINFIAIFLYATAKLISS